MLLMSFDSGPKIASKGSPQLVTYSRRCNQWCQLRIVEAFTKKINACWWCITTYSARQYSVITCKSWQVVIQNVCEFKSMWWYFSQGINTSISGRLDFERHIPLISTPRVSMESDCLISNYLTDLDCDTITAFTPGGYARHANCPFLHGSWLLAGEDIPEIIMHKTVSLIVSLFPNSAVNSLCYTYIQIYIQVALILALIFITVPKPKTRRGQIHSIRSHHRWLWIRDNYKKSVTTGW